MDSVTAGSNATEYSMYSYDGSDRLVLVEYVDSASAQVDSWDTIMYNGSGQMETVEQYWSGSGTPYQTTTITYNGAGDISNLSLAGDNGNGPWTMAHNYIYDGSAELTDIMLDPFSITGTPEGFVASWEDITWSNGNAITASIVGDLGAGVDTLELLISYDNGNSVGRLMHITEAGDAFMAMSANNMDQITFAQTEMMGPAGTVALDYDYTYTGLNEVLTREELSGGVFSDNAQTVQYSYDCSASVIEKPAFELDVYPNPFGGAVTVQFENAGKASIKVLDLSGKVMRELNAMNSTIELNLSEMAAGIYIIEVEQAGQTVRKKVIKS